MDNQINYGENQSNGFIKVVLFIVSLIASVTAFSALYFSKQTDELKTQVKDKQRLIAIKEAELSVLRALNPFDFEYQQIIESHKVLKDMMPGWVARIYQTPARIEDIDYIMDIGSFLIDESKFTLSAHENYGIDSLPNALYRLNGLLPTTMPGRYQIGVEFDFSMPSSNVHPGVGKGVFCFTSVSVNDQNAIEARVKFRPGQKETKLLTGDLNVSQGIHPISVLLYCENNEQLDSDRIKVSLIFREPGSSSFRSSSESVFHIYKQSRS